MGEAPQGAFAFFVLLFLKERVLLYMLKQQQLFAKSLNAVHGKTCCALGYQLSHFCPSQFAVLRYPDLVQAQQLLFLTAVSELSYQTWTRWLCSASCWKGVDRC